MQLPTLYMTRYLKTKSFLLSYPQAVALRVYAYQIKIPAASCGVWNIQKPT
ncbi:hypothetical protein [Rhodoferax sp.]|uniref:hypothetical protein n=1 Tax=Rhodoferax sp. TaxID=50421 RepID=UPI0026043768|nr:hypothetical protein [Rhodoferax sp.]MDD2920504.1 hypothetical protein [Rhodoferax sp.]